MNRRSFIAGILAVGAAPAIVRSDSLMKLIVPSNKVLANPADWGEVADKYTQGLIQSMNVTRESASAISLWPGIKHYWDQTYGELEVTPVPYFDLFHKP